jgi:tripartite-type tricarboxylate transporter receptor subunit TctC
MSGQLFKIMTSINMTRVTYRSNAAAITDLLGGQIQVVFATTLAGIEYLKAGTLRALAVTTPTRLDVLPNIPTVGEFLPGYEASGWWGIGAPRNTSAEIINVLNKEINAGLADPKLMARFADLGATVFPGSPADFGKLIADETEKWAEVVKFAGIKAD